MKLDIISIMKDVGASIRFEMTENIEAFETGIGTVYFTSPVTVKGTATNLNRMIEIKAEAQIDYRTVCDRCGEPLERHLTVPINENVIERNDENKDKTAEDDDAFTYTGHYIDLDPIVADAVILNLPMQHLCSEECRGLCPVCGRKLTGDRCECGGYENIDPRLEALKNYFKQ
jgi:Uncharacterized ACR, COG1399.